MSDLKLGKKPAVHDPRTLRLASYLDPITGVKVPAAFGKDGRVKNWGMLGNDQWGDCVMAGAAHETILWTSEPGTPAVKFTEQAVLSDYSAVTGFNPNDPNTDQGTDMLTAMKYRQHTGIQDATGQRHKIAAYVAPDITDYQRILEAVYLFGAVAIGIQFPQSAMDQFDAGEPWDVVKGSPIEGGHYVPAVGLHRGLLQVVTWGKRIKVTQRFLLEYCDEAFVPLSLEHLHGGKTPYGFDVAALQRDLAALKH